jgi:hypothetical protein
MRLLWQVPWVAIGVRAPLCHFFTPSANMAVGVDHLGAATAQQCQAALHHQLISSSSRSSFTAPSLSQGAGLAVGKFGTVAHQCLGLPSLASEENGVPLDGGGAAGAAINPSPRTCNQVTRVRISATVTPMPVDAGCETLVPWPTYPLLRAMSQHRSRLVAVCELLHVCTRQPAPPPATSRQRDGCVHPWCPWRKTLDPWSIYPILRATVLHPLGVAIMWAGASAHLTDSPSRLPLAFHPRADGAGTAGAARHQAITTTLRPGDTCTTKLFRCGDPYGCWLRDIGSLAHLPFIKGHVSAPLQASRSMRTHPRVDAPTSPSRSSQLKGRLRPWRPRKCWRKTLDPWSLYPILRATVLHLPARAIVVGACTASQATIESSRGVPRITIGIPACRIISLSSGSSLALVPTLSPTSRWCTLASPGPACRHLISCLFERLQSRAAHRSFGYVGPVKG